MLFFIFKARFQKEVFTSYHIFDAFNILSKKYGRGLHFIIAGDTNDLNLQPILNLSPTFCQIVQDFTRMDPPKLLDPILMTLSNYYQVLQCLDPLDSDPDKNGKKADHKIVVGKPTITVININLEELLEK